MIDDALLADGLRHLGEIEHGHKAPAANGVVTQPPNRALDLATLADVEPEAIAWLWRGRIARGKVSMVVGDPGDGKSYLSLAIAAAISRGHALPDGEAAAPADCLLWNGEDGLEDTIRVRAERVGADLARIHVICGTIDSNGQRESFGLHHVHELHREILRRGNIAAVFIDPLGALLAGVDAHRDAEVRTALQPLADLARETGVAIVPIAHLNKAAAGRSIYRVGGSIGFVGLARSVLLVARDQDTGRRAIVQLKSNVAEQVQPVEFRIDNEGLWWMGVADDLTADRMLAPAIDGNERSARDEARTAILEALSDAGGELRARDLDKAVLETGVSQRTYHRARAELASDGKISRQRSGFQGEVRWALPYSATLRHDGTEHKNVANNGELGEQCEPYSATPSHTSPPKHILSHSSVTTRARASEHGKLCSRCRGIAQCYEMPEGFVCTSCLPEVN